MKQENDIPDKIMERIRKLIRLKKSTTSGRRGEQCGHIGEPASEGV